MQQSCHILSLFFNCHLVWQLHNGEFTIRNFTIIGSQRRLLLPYTAGCIYGIASWYCPVGLYCRFKCVHDDGIHERSNDHEFPYNFQVTKLNSDYSRFFVLKCSISFLKNAPIFLHQITICWLSLHKLSSNTVKPLKGIKRGRVLNEYIAVRWSSFLKRHGYNISSILINPLARLQSRLNDGSAHTADLNQLGDHQWKANNDCAIIFYHCQGYY